MRLKTLFAALVALPLVGVSNSWSHAEEGIQVGLASVCITPEEPLWMQGYVSRPRYRPYEKVLDDIYAKAMAIRDSKGHSAVLITVDLCVMRPTEEAVLSRRIMDKTGLQREQIMLNLSHTHSAPIHGAGDMSRVPQKEEDRKRSQEYTERLGPLLAQAAAEALADLRSAKVSWGIGAGPDFIVNRRVYNAQGKYLRMGPNHKAWTDRRVHVLRVSDDNGKVRGVLFGCACHPVTLAASATELSADFPGWAMRYVEEQYPDAQAMFMQGCGADVNSHPRANAQQFDWVKRHGAALGKVVCEVLEDDLKPVRGPLQTQLLKTELPLQQVPPMDELKRRAKGPVQDSFNANQMLRALENGETLPTSYQAPLALWQFGDDLTLVGISGEVVSDYIQLVERKLGTEKLWIAGYTNQVFGYLPSRRIVQEGGYEARGLVASGAGWFAGEAEDVILTELQNMAQRAGRKLPE